MVEHATVNRRVAGAAPEAPVAEGSAKEEKANGPEETAK